MQKIVASKDTNRVLRMNPMILRTCVGGNIFRIQCLYLRCVWIKLIKTFTAFEKNQLFTVNDRSKIELSFLSRTFWRIFAFARP